MPAFALNNVPGEARDAEYWIASHVEVKVAILLGNLYARPSFSSVRVHTRFNVLQRNPLFLLPAPSGCLTLSCPQCLQSWVGGIKESLRVTTEFRTKKIAGMHNGSLPVPRCRTNICGKEEGVACMPPYLPWDKCKPSWGSCTTDTCSLVAPRKLCLLSPRGCNSPNTHTPRQDRLMQNLLSGNNLSDLIRVIYGEFSRISPLHRTTPQAHSHRPWTRLLY